MGLRERPNVAKSAIKVCRFPQTVDFHSHAQFDLDNRARNLVVLGTDSLQAFKRVSPLRVRHHVQSLRFSVCQFLIKLFLSLSLSLSLSRQHQNYLSLIMHCLLASGDRGNFFPVNGRSKSHVPASLLLPSIHRPKELLRSRRRWLMARCADENLE